VRNGQLVLVACTIRPGAFSGERVFQLPMSAPLDEYVGIAPVAHCFDQEKNPLTKGHPPEGSVIDGFVEAYLISNGGDSAKIELPDGEAVIVAATLVPYRRESDREAKYVPVGS
jgi:hypothetical protein